MYYINCFFIYSIIGHFIESFFYQNGKSGIFYGFYTPIYGIGVIIIILINNLISKLKIKKIFKVILLFLTCSIILTIMEYIGGKLIEEIFNITFWNYSNLKFNIGKYTALEMSLVWGFASLILIYFIKPLLDKFINKIPKFFSISLIILFIIDVVLTIITLKF